MEVSRGVMELQSALEGCESRFADLFVKGLGYLVRLGFQRKAVELPFGSDETHPFSKVRDVAVMELFKVSSLTFRFSEYLFPKFCSAVLLRLW